MGWRNADIYRIDATAHFGAAVDAMPAGHCRVFDGAADRFLQSGINPLWATSRLADRARMMTTDGCLPMYDAYRDWRAILKGTAVRRWRSGIKHDCARVDGTALTPCNGQYRNGLDATIQRKSFESDYLYPMLFDRVSEIRRYNPEPMPFHSSSWMIVPQTLHQARTPGR